MASQSSCAYAGTENEAGNAASNGTSMPRRAIRRTGERCPVGRGDAVADWTPRSAVPAISGIRIDACVQRM